MERKRCSKGGKPMLSKKHDKTGALQRAKEHVLRRPSSIYTEIKGLPVQDKLLNNLHKRFNTYNILSVFKDKYFDCLENREPHKAKNLHDWRSHRVVITPIYFQ